MLRSLVYFLIGSMGLSIVIGVFGYMARGKEYTIEELYAETHARSADEPQQD